MNKTFYFLVVLFTFAFLLSPSSSYAIHQNSVSYTIIVSATVGEPKLTLFGYTSPGAWVELKGTGVVEETISNSQGYFFFDRIFLPRPRPEYPELCLTAVDTQQRPSFPTCLPPLPVGPFNIQVGPVLLSPTISLEKGNFLPGEQVAAKGATIPNSEVTIFLAYDPSSLPQFSLISPVYAYSLPKYQIRSDENGSFEFNLPANQPTTWRVFAAAKLLGSPTPKSNTLTFRVLSWWQWLWEKIKLIFLSLLAFIKPYLWQLIILIEVIIILWLFRKRRLSKANLHSLRQGSIFHPRLDKILRRRGGRNIKNRPT